AAEAEVGRHRDRNEDAEDDDDHQQLDEGETALLTSQARLDLAEHVEISSDGVDWREAPAKWLSAHCSPIPRGQKGDRVPIFIPHGGGCPWDAARARALRREA